MAAIRTKLISLQSEKMAVKSEVCKLTTLLVAKKCIEPQITTHQKFGVFGGSEVPW